MWTWTADRQVAGYYAYRAHQCKAHHVSRPTTEPIYVTHTSRGKVKQTAGRMACGVLHDRVVVWLWCAARSRRMAVVVGVAELLLELATRLW